MNDIRRAIAHAATRLNLNYEEAANLPAKSIAALWEAREREQRANAAQQEQDQDGNRDDHHDRID